MELAPWLWYASGYAMETQELVSILEQFGGILPTKNPTIAEHGVDIFQIETINPHIHEERGEEHLINEILLPSLSTTYHSQLCEPRTKQLILDELRAQGYLEEGKELPKPHLYPPLQKVNMPRFQQFIHEPLPDYLVLGEPVLHAFL
jgi:mannosyl-3-phosphoglycerate synthase